MSAPAVMDSRTAWRAARRLWYVGPAVAYVVVIFVAGSARSTPAGATVNDKLLHAIGFAVMYWLAWRATIGMDVTSGARRWAAGLFSLAVGAALEAWQMWLPHRRGEIGDFVADAAGVALAAGALALLGDRRERLRRRSVVKPDS